MKQQEQQQPTTNLADTSKLKDTPTQKTGTHSPDTEDASRTDIQESAYGSRSYASPDFFKKKPRL